MSTTTSDSGASKDAQPTQDEAVAEHSDDQVITKDDNGTPTLAPVSNDDQPSADEAASDDSQDKSPDNNKEAQADDQAELKDWLSRKKLEVDFENPREVKLAEMQRQAEKKMHEATQAAKAPTPPPAPIDVEGDESYAALADTVNELQLKQTVNEFFTANPDAVPYREKMAEISNQRPWVNDLEALYAMAKTDPSREADIKKAGGKEALTNLAQKQQAIPPQSNATDSSVYESRNITPQNVYDLVEKNDQEWFEKNHAAINKAMAGK